MRPVFELLAQLRQLGIRIRVEGDRLRVNAPVGALTPELKSQIEAMKPQLLAFLRDAEQRHAREPDRIQPARSQGRVPLSFAQQRLWAMDRLGSKSMAYVTQVPVRIEGVLGSEAWRQSLAEFIRRHDILRSTIDEVDGEPCQGVRYPRLEEVPLVDLRHLSELHRTELVQRLIADDARFPFDLTRGPLVRRKLLWLGEREHVLLLIFHHIVADGWTLGILAKELFALYEAYRLGVPSPLPDLPLQFGDYVVWQRERLQGERLEELVSYWKRQLSSLPPVLDLPTDRPRPVVESFRGASKPFTLPKALDDALSRLASAERVSRFMVLLAALNVLLHRYTNQEDIAIGTVVANRNRSELEDLVGCFINTLVLRADLAGDPSFRDLLQQCRRVALDAFDHQDLPFDKLVEHLRPERSLSHSPLFQVMMMLQNAPLPQLDRTGLRVSALNIDTGIAPFDFSFAIFDSKSGWSFPSEGASEHEVWLGTAIYNTDLFDSATIDRFLAHFRQLLQSITETPHERISALRLLTREEEAVFNRAAAPSIAVHPGTLHERFQRQAERTPDSVAVVCEGHQLTYGELDRRSNQLAHCLRRRGIGPEVRVGLYVERGVEMIVGVLGILKAGGAYVPLDPAHSSERTARIIQETRLGLVLTQRAHEGTLRAEEPAPATLLLDDDWPTIARESTESPSTGVSDDNLAYVIFTSGSTGKPKGVLVSHANVVRLFEAAAPLFEPGTEDVWTLFHSIAFDFSVWEIWGALLHGGRLVVVPHLSSRSPEVFLQRLREERVTALSQTPSAFIQLANQVKESRPKLATRFVVLGGERLDPSELRPWCETYGDELPRLINMYGITETTVHVTYRRLKRGELSAGRSLIGEPLPGASVHVLDRRGRPAPVGVAGDVYVGGGGLARGYLDRPDLSADAFVPCPFQRAPGARMYRSGDVARWSSSGELEYLGRNDEQVKIRGFRIEPQEVSAALCEHPRVAKAVVVCQRDARHEQRLVAYFVASAGEVPSTGELSRFLSMKVPEYMVPSAYVALEALPLTGNGKIDRRALPAMEPIAVDPDQTYEPPRTPLETYLAAAAAEILGLDRVGVTDDFFKRGGHSLLAAKLITKVRQRGIQLSLRVLFKDPTVRGMAQAVEQDAPRSVKPASIPRVSREAYSVTLPPRKLRE
ncbi:amino acid adenylation domain-containing protein [Sorangium sp. So ce321]|uniref:non-ribosomal peptide synthetase n=1 Tax=Sorangium sp. So ce321 TaxID=3133300 RepID=UPI003F6056DB